MTSAPDRVFGNGSRLDGRARVALSLSLVLLATLTVWRVGTRSAPSVHEFAGQTMGTSFSVKVDAELGASEADRVRGVIEARLDQVNRLMSTFDSTSELSHFNQHRSTEPFPVSTELLEVLTMAREVSERSRGAFDVTVAPLVDAWGFGPEGSAPRTPDEAQLAALLDEPQLMALRERVGYRRILLDRAMGTVAKTHPETVVDLSAIAKGYGVERVASGLLDLGLTRFLVEVGGELKAAGMRRDGGAWRVGVESPDETARTLYGVLDLIDEAIATSGDYRNFYESEGGRYAHIIDPRTGSPIRFSGMSVSVVHDDAAMADAWATALIVLGPVVGYELAEREGIAALFVTRSSTAFRARTTGAFTERLGVLEEVGGR